MTLSLCMITKNEEKFLEKCLNSVKDIVDEIIIVDTGSSDKTKEIASKFTNKVFDFKWCDDFSKARNESISKASNDWVLVMDADEYLTADSCNEIQKMLSKVSSEVSGISLIQRNYTNDSQADNWVSFKDDSKEKVAKGWIPNPILRIFRKDVKYNGVVHETATDSAMKKGKIIVSDIPIHHLGHLNNEVVNNKKNYYGKLLKKKAEIQKDYGSYFELANYYLSQNDSELAISYINKSISLKDDFYASWFVLGTIHAEKKEFSLALESFERSLKLNSKNPATYLVMGEINMTQNEFLKAEENFIKAIEINPRNAKAHFNLGLCFNKQGKENKAYLALKNAIELDSKYKEIVEFDN